MGLFRRKVATYSDTEKLVGDLIAASNNGAGIKFSNENKENLINAYKHIVYICINKNSSVMSTIGFKLYSTKKPTRNISETRKLSDKEVRSISQKSIINGDVYQIKKHPFIDLMKNINSYTTYADFIYQTNTYKDLTGEAYWFIVKNSKGMPIELHSLPPQNMKIKLSNSNIIESYIFNVNDVEYEIKAEDVMHHKYFNPKNPLFGMSPLSAGESAYNIRESMDTYERFLYANNGNLSGVIETENEILGTPGWARLKKFIRNEIMGMNNTGSIAILDNGTKYRTIGSSPRDLENREGRKIIASEIRNIYGHTDALYEASANRSTSDTADYIFRKDAILPRINFLQNEINAKLLPLFDESLFMVFDNPVPIDVAAQTKRLTELVKTNIYSIDEAREELGKEPIGNKEE